MNVIHHVVERKESRFTFCGRDVKSPRVVSHLRKELTPERVSSFFPGDRLCKGCKKVKQRWDDGDRLREVVRKRQATQEDA